MARGLVSKGLITAVQSVDYAFAGQVLITTLASSDHVHNNLSTIKHDINTLYNSQTPALTDI